MFGLLFPMVIVGNVAVWLSFFNSAATFTMGLAKIPEIDLNQCYLFMKYNIVWMFSLRESDVIIHISNLCSIEVTER